MVTRRKAKGAGQKKTISQRPDAGKVEADRDAVSAGLAFQLQPTAALACNKGLTPICGPTKEANEPPSYVLSLVDQLRQVYEQSPLPATGSLTATLQQHLQNRDFPSRRIRKKPPGVTQMTAGHCSRIT